MLWFGKSSNPLDPGYLNSREMRRLGLGACGDHVKIARNVTLIAPENVRIGNHVRIDGFSTIVCLGGFLEIGDYVHIGGSGHINASAGIKIGDFSTLSQGVRLYSASDDFSGEWMTNSCVPSSLKLVTSSQISIMNHVVVGTGSIVLPGVTLGTGVAVGALSLVKSNLPEWNICAGVPAKVIKPRLTRASELSSQLKKQN